MTPKFARRRLLQTAALLPVAGLKASKIPDKLSLRNRHFQVEVAIRPEGIWLDYLALNNRPGDAVDEFTPNLLLAGDRKQVSRSTTAILTEGLGWYSAGIQASTRIGKRREWLQIDGVRLGPEDAPIAREKWTIELKEARLRWQIERAFLREVKVLADRFPALVFSTQASIPGFLDAAALLDGPHAFDLHIDGEWFEMVSPNRAHEIHFAPSGLILESRLETGFFSFAKTRSDGTVASVAIGAETADRANRNTAVHQGSVQKQTWTLQLKSGPGIAPLMLSIPDRFLNEQAQSFGAVNNQWMGWMFGNNPASCPILHEMAWYPMIQGIYGQSPVAASLERQLIFFAETGVEPGGYVFPRWTMSGYYRVMWGNLHDQIPHFISAMYFHAVNSGDRRFLRRVMPAVDRVAQYMLSLDRDGDGVVEVPGTSGLADGGRDCSNWYDIIKFGHKDAYINAYCCGALGHLAEMKAWLGDMNAAERFRETHRRFVGGFNRVFWDPDMGIYMDWVDIREQMPESGRRYFYTDPNLLAIIFGIADAAKSGSILGSLDQRYDGLCRQFGIPRDAIYATPCNMIPVSRMGDLVQFGELGNQKIYPNYENGCSFFHTTGLEIAARALAGQADTAYETFERVMRNGYAKNRLWAAALKWDTGKLISEPLNNALLVLWGFVRGCLGVWPSLDGLRFQEGVSKRMEGAQYTFCHLGRNVTILVRDGKAQAVLGPESAVSP